jgi:hypothetical protein
VHRTAVRCALVALAYFRKLYAIEASCKDERLARGLGNFRAALAALVGHGRVPGAAA